jgi:hypothetical protein
MSRFTLSARSGGKENTMRKLTILVVLLALVVALLALVIPPLCITGGGNLDSCDLVTLLRGGIRLINSAECRSPSAVCQVVQAAGLK